LKAAEESHSNLIKATGLFVVNSEVNALERRREALKRDAQTRRPEHCGAMCGISVEQLEAEDVGDTENA